MEANALKPFEYFVPADVNEALSLLDRWKDDARVIAGGTDLIPLMRDKLVTPQYVIDINRLSELEYIKETSNGIRIGALTRLRTIETSPLIQQKIPVLAQAATQVGSIQVRNVGTIGGSLANASPAADVAPPLLVCEARVKTKSLNREREIPLSEFFTGVKKTTLGNDELLTDIEVPKIPPRTGGDFLKVGKRNALVISIASAAAIVTLNETGRNKIRIALGSVAPTPIRARKTESFLEERNITDQTINEASELVDSDVSPITDMRASAEYRKEVSKILVRRVLQKAIHTPLWGRGGV
jgi:carbon-monoxide dehydrogenase medium subunit